MDVRNARTNNADAKRRLREIAQQIYAVEAQKKPLQDEYNNLSKAISDTIERRIRSLARGEGAGRFTPDELIFAASSRCECGAGLAYPDGIGAWGFWDCSAILLGTADASVKHTGQLPFTFYEIKSEGQPSANGATTRPSCNGQHDAPPCGPICFAVTIAD